MSPVSPTLIAAQAVAVETRSRLQWKCALHPVAIDKVSRWHLGRLGRTAVAASQPAESLIRGHLPLSHITSGM